MFQQTIAYPLSPQQRRLWSLRQESTAYRTQIDIGITGPVDAAGLRSALGRVVARHEILRTSFHCPDGESMPVQVIGGVDAWHWHEADSPQNPDGPGDRALRAVLTRLSPGACSLILTASPLCADAGALFNIAAEVIASYAGDANGAAVEEPLQYAQFAEWQNQMIQSEHAGQGEAYWRTQLDVSLEGLRLPQELAKNTVFAPDFVRVPLPPTLVEKLGTLSGEEPRDVALACWHALLWRLIRQPQIVVASACDGREHDELRGGIGFYTRYVPVLCRFSPGLTYRELLARVTEASRKAREWLPYAPVDNSNGAMEWPSAFPYLFSYHESLPSQNRAGLRFTLAGHTVCNEPFKLKLDISGSSNQWHLDLAYDAGRFSSKDVDTLAEQYLTLLHGAVHSPDLPVLSLPLNSPRQQTLLRSWRRQPLPAPASDLIAWFEQQVALTPDAPAILFGSTTLTYGQINSRANQLARHLRHLGVGPEIRVALFFERSLDMLVAIVAVLKAGGAYVPLDPEFPAQRLAWMLEETQARVVLTHAAAAHRLPPTSAPLLDLSDCHLLAAYPLDNLPLQAQPDNAAYVIYTSGSTGRPKGVVITRHNIARLFQSTQCWYQFSARDVWSMCHNYAFDVSVWEMWGAWLYGGKLVLVSTLDTRSPEQLCALLEREQVTILSQTPSAFRQLAQQVQRDGRRPLCVRALVFAGEALDPAMLRGWSKLYPETALLNMYGITETTVHSTYKRLSAAETRSSERSPIGVEFADLRTYLLQEDLTEAGLWETGEIYLAGAGLARCYLQRPDLTAERFLPELDGPQPGQRMYRSGDLARRRSDGEMEYVGRRDHQVKIRGYRVELGEIEAALRQQAGVREAAVLVKGEAAEQRLVGYLFRQADHELDVETVRLQLQRTLPDYMVPAVFVLLDEMPLTANGKLDKRALPEPGTQRPELKQVYVPPRTDAEKLLVQVWSEVLGIDQIGIQDNYFVLGGDSIRSVRIVALAKKRGLRISLQSLFQNQTIVELAREGVVDLEQTQSSNTRPFSLISQDDFARLPEGIEDAYPITMLQGGMLFHLELEPDGSIYHNVVSFNIEAPFVADYFQRAVHHVVSRHAILRTSFDLVSYSAPLQLVHASAPLHVEVFDIRGLASERQQEIVVRHVEEQRQRRFDISKPPLLRFHIHRKTDDNFNFTITDCHAILDGWSLTSTIAEIFNYYFSLAAGEPPIAEPPIAVTYRDFVHLERQAIESPVFRDFWRRKLEGSRPTLVPRWPFQSAGGAHNPVMRFTLEVELLTRLNALSQSLGVSLKSTLLAAHMKVLSLLTGQSDVLTGLSCHGRPEVVDSDRLRGNFLNTIPYRLRVEEGTWSALIRQAFAAEIDLLPFQLYPLAVVQKEWGRKIYIETLFAVLNFHSLEQVAHSGKLKFLSYGNVETSETNFAVSAIFWISPFPEMLPSTLFLQFTRDMGPVQIEAIGTCYLSALEAIATEPESLHTDLSLFELLADQERTVLQMETGVEELERSFSF